MRSTAPRTASAPTSWAHRALRRDHARSRAADNRRADAAPARWRDAGIAVPVLVLTARGSWHEKVQGIDGGADDYVAKPFRMEEVLARLRALIRRASGQVDAGAALRPVVLDPRTREVTLDGAPVKLTSHEFRVLSYLMHHRGRVVSQARADGAHLRAERRPRFEHRGSVHRASAPQARCLVDRDRARARLSHRGAIVTALRSLRGTRADRRAAVDGRPAGVGVTIVAHAHASRDAARSSASSTTYPHLGGASRVVLHGGRLLHGAARACAVRRAARAAVRRPRADATDS